MKKVAHIFFGTLLIIFGCWATIQWWDVFVLALKGTAGIISLLVGAFLIYFSRKEGSVKKLSERVTHTEDS